MSVDVMVVGATGPPAAWGEIRGGLLPCCLPPGADTLLGPDPQLLTLGSHRLIEPGERLAPGGHYYLRLREDNTLGVAVQAGPDPDEPLDYLEDFGRNISPDEIRDLAGRWGRAGYCYRVTTFGGRHQHELPVFVALAAVLGELSGGSVMWIESVWFGVGVYPPGVFRRRLGRLCGTPALLPNVNPAWITPAVAGVARGIDHDSAFDRLPALADALEDAGCEDQAVLSHCRADGPHISGCWVVDFALRGEEESAPRNYSKGN